MTWNVLGILDLVVAVSMGALSSGLAAGVAGEITTGPMSRLPLVLVPAYLVPLFVMLHVAALLQARRVGAHVSLEIEAGDALPKRLPEEERDHGRDSTNLRPGSRARLAAPPLRPLL